MPSSITAGDTLLVSLGLTAYPATEWTVTFSFRAAEGSAIDLTATASGSYHLINEGPTSTVNWMAERYSGFGRATNIADATLAQVFWRGELEVLPNLATAEGDYDTRSWAKKCLDLIEAVLQGKASRDVLNSTIAGQSIGRMTPEQLWLMRDRFKAEYQAEQAADAAAQGKGQGSNICIRFTLP